MNRILPFAIAGLSLLALTVWERSLSARASDVRLERVELRPLVQPGSGRLFKDDGQANQVVGLSLTFGRSESYLYARVKGLWRCLGYRGLPADAGRVTGLMQALLDAQGIVETTPDSASGFGLEAFGLGPAERMRIELHGTELKTEPRNERLQAATGAADVLLTIDVGNSLPDGRGCYARVFGEESILALDSDLRGRVESSIEAPLPPLADNHLIPAAWPGFSEALTMLQVVRPSDDFELYYEPSFVEGEPGAWKALPSSGGPLDATPMTSLSYTVFLQRAEFIDAVDPRTLQPELVENPAARVILLPTNGERLELSLLAPDADGSVVVTSSWTGVPVRVDATIASILAPDIEVFTDPARAATYEAYVR